MSNNNLEDMLNRLEAIKPARPINNDYIFVEQNFQTTPSQHQNSELEKLLNLACFHNSKQKEKKEESVNINTIPVSTASKKFCEMLKEFEKFNKVDLELELNNLNVNFQNEFNDEMFLNLLKNLMVKQDELESYFYRKRLKLIESQEKEDEELYIEEIVNGRNLERENEREYEKVNDLLQFDLNFQNEIMKLIQWQQKTLYNFGFLAFKPTNEENLIQIQHSILIKLISHLKELKYSNSNSKPNTKKVSSPSRSQTLKTKSMNEPKKSSTTSNEDNTETSKGDAEEVSHKSSTNRLKESNTNTNENNSATSRPDNAVEEVSSKKSPNPAPTTPTSSDNANDPEDTSNENLPNSAPVSTTGNSAEISSRSSQNAVTTTKPETGEDTSNPNSLNSLTSKVEETFKSTLVPSSEISTHMTTNKFSTTDEVTSSSSDDLSTIKTTRTTDPDNISFTKTKLDTQTITTFSRPVSSPVTVIKVDTKVITYKDAKNDVTKTKIIKYETRIENSHTRIITIDSSKNDSLRIQSSYSVIPASETADLSTQLKKPSGSLTSSQTVAISLTAIGIVLAIIGVLNIRNFTKPRRRRGEGGVTLQMSESDNPSCGNESPYRSQSQRHTLDLSNLNIYRSNQYDTLPNRNHSLVYCHSTLPLTDYSNHSPYSTMVRFNPTNEYVSDDGETHSAPIQSTYEIDDTSVDTDVPLNQGSLQVVN
ncbi:hypothetical protein HK099_007445 [Clydaea vesicula]|uniref:Uncharacterized protein n=1 Tax=Clydaea vesicula TaxID=447962 RepID=A0AAD5U6Q2_9FUNG|nr:hypothetical protein HK099_007445 [Clydaea vesicula]